MDGPVTANVAQLFFDAAARHETTPAFVAANGERVTFGALRLGVENFAAGLRADGFGPGERAVFMLPMSPQLYVAVLGALAAGGVAVFVDPWVSVRQIARLAAAARPSAFIGTPKAHVLRLLSSALRRVPITVASEGFGAGIVARRRFRDLRGHAPVVAVSAEASALITYTTGSSGVPKGVNRTHAILAAQHRVIREEFPAVSGDVDLTTFPVFALSNLAAGVTTVIPPVDLRRIAQADARLVLAHLRTFGVSTMAASPPLFDLLAERLRVSGEEAPLLRRIVSGGAPVRDDQLRRWREAFPNTEIVVAYGSSEAEPVASMTAEERRDATGVGAGYCVGKPVAAVRARAVGIERGAMTEARDVSAGAVGELLVAGPHVCRDYAGDPAAAAENKVRDADGTVWHRMGDTGYFDERGRFWLVGRVHSTIRRNGVDLHAQVIEQAARSDDARIRGVAAMGMPDERLGERLVVVVESDVDVSTDVRARLARIGIASVDQIERLRAPLPVDPRHNSKVDYARLRDMIGHGTS